MDALARHERAKTQLVNATVRLYKLLGFGTHAEVEKARRSLNNARVELRRAENAYTKKYGRSPDNRHLTKLASVVEASGE